MENKDLATLFKCFDYTGDGEIDFNEFVRVIVGPMNQFRTNLALKAFKLLDRTGDGEVNIDDIRGNYNASMHPDVKSGKRTEDEILTEFLETFEQHYNNISGGKSDGKITPQEWLEYYTHVSANIDSDAYFELMMANTWNIESSNNPASMPYAGSKAKIAQVSSREAYLRDHHRNLFGTDKQTPFANNQGSQWQTSTAGSYTYQGDGSNIPMAGGGRAVATGAANMAFLTESQRMTPVDYRGIKNSDDQLVEAFRAKLASRGARGLLGMQRVFKIMDDNGSGTLDI